MERQDRVRGFVEAAQAAYDAQLNDPRGRRSTARIFEALRAPPEIRAQEPVRLAACDHLQEAADPQRFDAGPLRDLVAAFLALEPHLAWYRRRGDAPGANAAYPDGHANAMIVGPGGLARHPAVWLGASLLAPGVRYPDHTHPPEESYLVLSEGDFFQEGAGWFTPGRGGSFYNPPGILHAMRSGEAPLFAIWALWAEAAD